MSRRRHSQDFSGESKTDQSFGPSCDVNAIVRHYDSTGLDPFEDRKKLERFGEASSIPYEAAMRAKAEIDSAFALLPSSERLEHDNDANRWFESTTTPEAITEPPATPPEAPAEPAPQDAPEAEPEA